MLLLLLLPRSLLPQERLEGLESSVRSWVPLGRPLGLLGVSQAILEVLGGFLLGFWNVLQGFELSRFKNELKKRFSAIAEVSEASLAIKASKASFVSLSPSLLVFCFLISCFFQDRMTTWALDLSIFPLLSITLPCVLLLSFVFPCFPLLRFLHALWPCLLPGCALFAFSCVSHP